MKSIRTFVIALLLVSVDVGASPAATVPGMVGDGKTSLYYVTSTGEFTIQPDGRFVGLFDIQSASGIFTAAAALPPNGLFVENSANRKSWAALSANAFITDFSLGVIAAPGLSLDFLLNDLTMQSSGGFGTPHNITDLIYTIPEPATAALGGLALFVLVGSRPRRKQVR